MESKQIPYKRQIFVCVHNANGEKASCGDHQGEQIFRQLRETAKERKLHPMIRVAQAKCLGQCNTGCNIMIYPENLWISNVNKKNIKKIIDSYLV